MLFGGGRAFDWSVSIRQVDVGYGAYIVTTSYKDLKMVCLERIARRLPVDLRTRIGSTKSF